MSNSETTRTLLFSRRQAAEQLGLCVRSVDFLIKSNRLAAIHLGSRVLIAADDLAAFAKTGSGRIRPKQ